MGLRRRGGGVCHGLHYSVQAMRSHHHSRVAIVALQFMGLRNQVVGTKIPIDSPVRVCYLERSRTLAKGCGGDGTASERAAA
jgi:hypothetical protein